MAEWVHKAMRPRASHVLARDIAVVDHFLCRSIFAHVSASQTSARPVDVVDEVAVGDVIHYYYRTASGLIRCFGSFRVVDPSGYALTFEPCPGHGALVRVLSNAGTRQMLHRLQRGYWPDPELDAFTGWVIERLPIDAGTPGFDQAKMFPSLTTSLWRYPDPELPRRRALGQPILM